MKKFILGFALFEFALLCGLAVAGLTYRPGTEIPAGLKGQFVQAGGASIRCYQAGQGPDLLLIHGCPGSIEDWDPVLEKLAQKYRVTAYDRPGHGYSYSGLEGNGYNLEYNARVAFDLIRTLGLKDPVVVGHSYGSATGLAMAIQDPDNIKSFVLIASPGYKPVDVDFLSYVLAVPYLGEGFARVAGRWVGPSKISRGILNGFSPNEDKVTEDFIALRTQMWLQPKVGVTRSRELVNLEKDLMAMVPAYKDIRKKVFIVQGKGDDVTKAAWKLHGDIPGSELTVFENTGHYTQFIHPEEVIRIVDKASSM